MNFLKFCIAGLINTSINIFIMYFFLILNTNILIASGLGFCAGAISGFCLNFYFTFNVRDRFMDRLIVYLIIQFFCLFITLMMVSILSLRLGFNPLISQLIAIISTTVINYYLSKRFVFEIAK